MGADVGNSNRRDMLTAKFVEGVRTAGVYRDKGNPGLLLRVGPGDSKRWVLRTTFNGSRRDIGLGSARDITLSDAREEAATLRRAARAGRDPTAERRSVKHVRLTFAEAAEKVHAARKDQWRNGKHVEQ